MTKEEYLAARTSLAVKYFELCEKLKVQYASENARNIVKVGDLITTSKTALIVEGINFTVVDDKPEIIYRGVKVKKDGSKYKHSQIIEINDDDVVSVTSKEE